MAEKTDALRDSAGLSSRQTQRMMEEAQLRQGWLNGGGKLEDAGYAKELAALRNIMLKRISCAATGRLGQLLAGMNIWMPLPTPMTPLRTLPVPR
jgi:hypothetical protein